MGGSLHQPDLPTPENLSSSDSALSLVICLLYSPKKIWEIVSYPHPMFLDSLDMSPQGPETSIFAQLSAYYSLGATNWRFPSTEMYCSVVVVFWQGLLLTRPCVNLYICMPWMGLIFGGWGWYSTQDHWTAGQLMPSNCLAIGCPPPQFGFPPQVPTGS